MSSNRACHHISGISSLTGHVISLGISSPTVHTGHFITHRTSPHPLDISSATEVSSPTGHLITHRTSHYPPNISLPTGHLITHRTSHYPPNISLPTGHLITHRAFYPTGHVIPPSMLSLILLMIKKTFLLNGG